jgi:hypothetical protein
MADLGYPDQHGDSAAKLLFQTPLIPARVSRGSKEHSPLVIVQPIHVPSPFGEIEKELGFNEPRRAREKQRFHHLFR